ncbi:MAG: sugar-binding protein, partial [Monoglobaceae bacterium]
NGTYNLFKGLYGSGDLYIVDPYYTNYSNINYGNNQKYSADKWYRIDNYIDLDSRKMYIYIDGELYVQGPLPDYYKEFCGIKLVQNAAGDAGSYYDNIEIYRMNGEIGFDFIDKEKSIPKDYANYASVAFKADTVGNIFFEDTGVKFDAEIRNSESRSAVLNGRFYVTDGYNNIIWTKENTYSLKPYEKAVETLDIDTRGQKGYFNLIGEFTTDKASRIGSVSTRFSVLASPEGHNSRWGVGNHFDRNGGKSAEMTEIMSKAGIGTVRVGSTTMQWNDFETEKGVYKYNQITDNTLDIVSSNGMQVMQLMYGKNPIYKGEHPPHSDDEIAAFAKACYEWVKAAGDRVQLFEVWNEYDLPTFNPERRPVEDYVRMLKAVYPAVKAANPNAIVVGLSPSGQAWEWARSAVDAGALDYMDAVSIHPYAAVMSPETYDMVGKIKSFKDYCAEKGYDDIMFVASETGWSSGDLGSTKLQAAYELRWMTLNTYYDLIDVLCKYTAQDHDISSIREQNFGFFKFWKYVDIPYEAKDNLLAVSAYNTVMNGAAAIDDISGDKGNIFRFALPDGRQVIVAYALSGSADMAFTTSASVMEYIDMYGNRSEIKSNGGKVNLHLTDNPIYLVCDDFGDIAEAEADFVTNASTIYGTPSGKSLFSISGPSDGVSFEYSLMSGMSVEKEYTKDGVYYAELRMPSVMQEKDAITVKAVKDGSVIYRGEFPIGVTNGVNAYMKVRPYKNTESDRWEAVVTAENTNYDEVLDGTFTVTKPEALAKAMNSIEFEPIAGGESKEISFFLPEIFYRYNIEGVCEFSNGTKVEVGDDYRLTTASYADSAPEIDGVISEGEWSEDSYVTQAQFEVVIESHEGKNDLNVNKMYTMWDEEYLYISAEILDDKLDYEHSKERIWAGDSIQFAIAFEKKKSAPRTEIGFGLDKNFEPAIERTLFMGSADAVAFEGYEVKILRDEENKLTTYEAKFPWDVMIPDNIRPEAGKTMYISFLLNENDDGTRLGWAKCGDGIDTEKDPSKYNELHLLKSKKSN